MTEKNSSPVSMEAMLAEIAKLQAENDALKASKPADGLLTLKVSEKGALSIYGLSRFPVTLYGTGISRLFSPAQAAKVNEFALANVDRLSFVKLVKDGGKDDKGNDTFRASTDAEKAEGEVIRAKVRAALEANIAGFNAK